MELGIAQHPEGGVDEVRFGSLIAQMALDGVDLCLADAAQGAIGRCGEAVVGLHPPNDVTSLLFDFAGSTLKIGLNVD